MEWELIHLFNSVRELPLALRQKSAERNQPERRVPTPLLCSSAGRGERAANGFGSAEFASPPPVAALRESEYAERRVGAGIITSRDEI